MRLQFSVTTYFRLALLAGIVFMSTVDTVLGASYLLAAGPLVLFSSRFLEQDDARRMLLFNLCVMLWAFYLVRPLFLALHPSFYLYSVIRPLTHDRMAIALVQLSGYFFLLIIPFHLSLRLGQKAPMALPPWLTNGKASGGALIRGRSLIIAIMLAFASAQFAMSAFAGVAISGTASSRIEVFLQLSPATFVIPLSLIYMIAFAEKLSPLERGVNAAVLLIGSATLLVQGHKGFFLVIAHGVFMLLVLRYGDFKMRAGTAALIATAASVASILTFSVAMMMRSRVGAAGLGPEAVAGVTAVLAESLSQDELIAGLHLLTSRLTGFDGLLAANASIPPGAEGVFDELSILHGFIARLLPGIHSDQFSLGQSVVVHFMGLPSSVQSAGALGLIGSLKVIGHELLYLVGIGLMFGLAIRLTVYSDLIGAAAKALLLYLLLIQSVAWINSGNLDNLLQSVALLVVKVIIYGILVHVIVVAIGGPPGQRVISTRAVPDPAYRYP